MPVIRMHTFSYSLKVSAQAPYILRPTTESVFPTTFFLQCPKLPPHGLTRTSRRGTSFNLRLTQA